jgi:uncharacterized protein (TIGR03066 family)
MRSIVVVGVVSLAIGLTAVAGEIEGKKLIGAWEVTKVEGEDKVPHWRIEFQKEGKLRMTSKREDKEHRVEGTYALKKNQLMLTAKKDGKTVDTKTVMILELTDDVLIFVDNEKKLEFKRAK